MNAFDAARVDEDLAPRHRPGQVGDERGIELEGERFVPGRSERIGAQDRADDRPIEPQQAVVVDRRDAGEARADRLFGEAGGNRAVAAESRIVPHPEQLDQRARHHRRAAQRVDHGVDREGHAGLAQVAIERAQPVGFVRGQPGADDQSVEQVVLGPGVEHGCYRRLDRLGAREQRRALFATWQAEVEIVDRARVRACELGRMLGQDAETEVLERRNRVRQRHRSAELIDLEPQLVCRIAVVAKQPRVAAQRA